MDNYCVILLIFQHGACVNVADLWKFTPLHEAAAKGKFEICKLLLKVCKKDCPRNFLSDILNLDSEDYFLFRTR